MRTRRATDPGPVLVLTNHRDFAADEVIRRLLDAGAHVVRYNIEDARCGGIESVSIGPTRPTSGPRCIWWRQFENDLEVTSLTQADDALVERAQWRSWLAALRDGGSVWVNDLWAARRAESKVEQLRCAGALGFSIPQTLITNRLDDARTFQRDVGPCVVKTLSAGYFELSDRSFVYTTDLTDAEWLANDDAWNRQPVIVQRKLHREADVRVVAFGGHYFGAACISESADWRRESAAIRWQDWHVPEHLAEMCGRYLAAMGLRFAAFDFALEGHSTWFLEANQAGEWLFLDRPLKLGIADALARYLVELTAIPR